MPEVPNPAFVRDMMVLLSKKLHLRYLVTARDTVSWKSPFLCSIEISVCAMAADAPSYERVLLTYIDDNYSILFDRNIELVLDTMLGCKMVVYKPALCSLLRCYCRFR